MNITEKQRRLEEIITFLHQLYDKIPKSNFVYLWTKQGKETFPFALPAQISLMAQKAISLADGGVDVYHSVNTVNIEPIGGKRGDENSVSYQTAIVVDIDIFKGNDKFVIDEISSLRVVLARMNQNPDRILSDKKVREAFISGCDRETYNKVLLKDTFLPGKAPVPPSLDYGFDQLTDPNAYNPERAAKLLDEAGWKDSDGDGIREKDGKKLELDFVVYNSRAELPLYAEAVQSDLKKLGFDIKINTVDYNLIDNMGIKGEYDLLISNITTANTGDPEIFLTWYWKTNTDGSNPQNGSGYSNPEYDAKLEQLSTEFDAAKRRRLIIELQQILLNDAASIFFGYPQTNIINSKRVTGVKMYPSDYYWITNLIKPAK